LSQLKIYKITADNDSIIKNPSLVKYVMCILSKNASRNCR